MLGKKSKQAASAATNGALLRAKNKKKKKKAELKKREMRESVFRIKEAKEDEDGRLYFPVTIIAEGLGNLRDMNYYTAMAIQSGIKVYEGAQAYYDHPSPTEEENQPNRTINKLLGHYENCKAVTNSNGCAELQARLYIIEGISRADATDALNHAVIYKTKYPDKDFVGISINGDGEGETLEFDQFVQKYSPPAYAMQKLKQVEGKDINAITKLSDAFSADVVTAPGAGGKINTKEERQTMFKAMKKFFSGLERNDYKTAEAAVKDMLQAEDGDDKDSKKKEAAEDDSAVKKMLQAVRREMQKEKDETEEAYEGRVVAAFKKEIEAYVGAKKEASEKDEAEGEDKKEGDDKKDKKAPPKDSKKDDGDDDEESESEDKKEASEKDESEGEDDKKEASEKDESEDDKKEGETEKENENEDEAEDDKKEGEDDDGDDDDDDKGKGKKDAPGGKGMKQMVKQMKSQQKQIEALMAEMKQMKQSEKEAKKESAALSTELKLKKRAALVESKLAGSRLPYEITKLWKPVLERCTSDKEIDDTIIRMKETAAKVNAERFFEVGSVGLIERAAEGSGNNDDLF